MQTLKEIMIDEILWRLKNNDVHHDANDWEKVKHGLLKMTRFEVQTFYMLCRTVKKYRYNRNTILQVKGGD